LNAAEPPNNQNNQTPAPRMVSDRVRFPEHLQNRDDLYIFSERFAWTREFAQGFFHQNVTNVWDIELSWESVGGTFRFGEYLEGFIVQLDDYSIWGWGRNDYGQLGDGTTQTRRYPAKILDSVFRVSSGWSGSRTATQRNGDLWAWGSNESGQLGDGTTINRLSPVRIMGNVVLADINGFGNGGIALQADGTLWTWGENSYGRLGDGAMTARHTPVMVMDDVVTFSRGSGSGVIVRRDGSLWAWGQHQSWDEITREHTMLMDSPVPEMIATNTGPLPAESSRGEIVADDGRIFVAFWDLWKLELGD